MKDSKQKSRRTFIKQAGALGAGAFVLPSILPSCVKWKGANDRINVAAVGVGSRGTAEMRYYMLPHDTFRVVATCDPFESRRNQAAKLVKDHYAAQDIVDARVDPIEDYRDLLDRKDIDMLAITTPDHWHVPIAIEAVRAGKHVHVNKPLGLSLEALLTLRQELKHSKVHFNYGTQQRSYDFMAKAMEFIHTGAIGTVEQVVVWAPGGDESRHIGYHKEMEVPKDLNYDLWQGPAPVRPYTADRVHRDGSFFINDYSIGFLGGWGAHPLDIMVWGLKERMAGSFKVEATGRASWPEGSLYNNINQWDAKIHYDSGLKLHFLSQEKAKPVVMKYQSEYRQNGTLFIGSKGWITLSRTYAESNIPALHAAINNFPKKSFGLDGDRGLHLVKFAELIRGERKSYMDIDDALLNDYVAHAVNAAIRLDQKLEFNCAAAKVRNSEAANQILNRPHRDAYRV